MRLIAVATGAIALLSLAGGTPAAAGTGLTGNPARRRGGRAAWGFPVP